MELLTIKQAAERLGLSERTVRAMVGTKALPCYRIGPRHGRIMIDADDCERYLRSCRVERQEESAQATVKRPTNRYVFQYLGPARPQPKARRSAR